VDLETDLSIAPPRQLNNNIELIPLDTKTAILKNWPKPPNL
jgi:hypothetical protein